MSPSLRALLFSPLLAAAALAADTGAGLPKSSPFLSPAGAAAAPAANENLEFAGVSSVGKRTDLIFHDKSLKKSHWIGLGETKEGIAVLNYDAAREIAVIKVNGVEKSLTLRKGTTTASSGGIVIAPSAGFPAPLANNLAPAAVQLPPASVVPSPAPTPTPPPAPAAVPAGPHTPETLARQETEARMLVSDLLEIGMAQRKAYEDAQRKAAEGNPTPAPAPAAPVKPSGG